MFFQKQFQILMIFFTAIPFWSSYANPIQNPLSIWPKPEKDYQRIIIQLPTLPDEKDKRVELVPQKKVNVDCNLTIIHGALESQTLQGWGYSYYRLDKLSSPVSTLMACPQQSKQKRLISISTDLPFIDYNSQIPIVVYIPKNIYLAYRIWSASSLHQGNRQ